MLVFTSLGRFVTEINKASELFFLTYFNWYYFFHGFKQFNLSNKLSNQFWLIKQDIVRTFWFKNLWNYLSFNQKLRSRKIFIFVVPTHCFRKVNQNSIKRELNLFTWSEEFVNLKKNVTSNLYFLNWPSVEIITVTR